MVYENGVLKRIWTENGYYENGNYYFYIKNHLGSNGIVANIEGTVVQQNHYYPFGLTMGISDSQGAQPYKYTGKELDMEHGLMLYDYEVRQYDPAVGRFTTMDPLAEKYYSVSPYAYCLNNPVRYVDPDGMSTYVIQNSDGSYRVVGGNKDDDDLNIYSINFKDGKYAGMSSIGKSTSMTSFYNDSKDENGKELGWMGTIDPNDNSGKQFLDNFVKSDLEIGDYMDNAKRGQQYDFKRTNGTVSEIYSQEVDFYRGMPVQTEKDRTKVYTSARDVGNIAAGYIAGAYGIPWAEARKEFDKLQSAQDGRSSVEGMSTQNAQRVGWETGYRDAQRVPGAMMLRWVRSIPTAWRRMTK
jgi:RHS repeat-associated protein